MPNTNPAANIGENRVHILQNSSKNLKTKTTALSIPMWSPTIVLTEPLPACLRRSDGIRNFLVCMAVALEKKFFCTLIYSWHD